MNESSTTSDRPLYLYVAFLGNLIAAAGMAFLLLGILGALGLISAVTDSLGGFGSSFASATTGSAAAYSFAFLASLLSLSASWKMLREGPRLWLLVLVVVFQLAAAAVFHSWVSVIALIPTVAALYGLVLVLRSAPVLRGPAPTPAIMPRETPASATAAPTVQPRQATSLLGSRPRRSSRRRSPRPPRSRPPPHRSPPQRSIQCRSLRRS